MKPLSLRRLAGILTMAAVVFPVGASSDSLIDQLRKKADALVPGMEQLTAAASEKMDELIAQVTPVVPVLDKMGFELSTVRTKVGLPPRLKMRFVSRSSDGPVAAIEPGAAEPSGLAKIVLASAISARNAQKAMGMEAAIIDVDVTLPPKIKTTLLKKGYPDLGSMALRLEDIDLLCSQSIPD